METQPVPQQESLEAKKSVDEMLGDAFGELLPGERAVIERMPAETINNIKKFVEQNPAKFSSTEAVKDYLSGGANAMLRAEATREREAPAKRAESAPQKAFDASEISSVQSAQEALAEHYGGSGRDFDDAMQEFNTMISPYMSGEGRRPNSDTFQTMAVDIVKKVEARKQQRAARSNQSIQ